MKYCCMSPIMRSANSVEKMQVFCAWSSLRMSACTVPHRLQRGRADLRVDVRGQHLVTGHAQEQQPQPVVALGQFALVARTRHATLLVERVDALLDLLHLAL